MGVGGDVGVGEPRWEGAISMQPLFLAALFRSAWNECVGLKCLSLSLPLSLPLPLSTLWLPLPNVTLQQDWSSVPRFPHLCNGTVTLSHPWVIQQVCELPPQPRTFHGRQCDSSPQVASVGARPPAPEHPTYLLSHCRVSRPTRGRTPQVLRP